MDRIPPTWLKPTASQPTLKVFNTLTRSKVPFIPLNGPTVTWYSCGPTVYDSSHMGHARSYITFDILRRILEDYFGYSVLYVMNITDIDDKIIVRARQNYLVQKYKESIQDLSKEKLFIKGLFKEFMEKNLQVAVKDDLVAAMKELEISAKPKLANLTEDSKYGLYYETAKKIFTALENQLDKEAFVAAVEDILAPHLDSTKGSTVTDQKIFRELSAYWEADFLKDMSALNVKPADVMTRVSEYIPEIIECIEKIIANGYGYEANGSVYFDTDKFHGSSNHFYAKLCPNSAGNSKLTDEGEGSLSLNLTGKKSPHDFALWKKSKSGEPEWDSPWSKGRPGWHIECSAMSKSIIPGTIDIHSGGIDLAFPHHDNEMAQSEGYYECTQWINYFFHAGHLNIEGQKMSKSLKNFVTIKEALLKYSSRQIRIMFLMHTWNALLDYKESSMEAAKSVESSFYNFIASSEALSLEAQKSFSDSDGTHNHNKEEMELLSYYLATERKVHEALCDSFDTPTVIKVLLDLINKANVYIKEKKNPSAAVLDKVRNFLLKMLRIFGVHNVKHEKDEKALACVIAASSYRDSIRELALKKADHKEFLALSDNFRDQVVDLGYFIEDRDGGRALVKESHDLKKPASKADEKEARRLETLRKTEERLLKGKLDPKKMFEGFYSKIDEEGLPTHELDGSEVAKSKRKRLVKEMEAQSKLHEEYLRSLNL